MDNRLKVQSDTSFKKASVLFVLKVPPPVHGSTIMNQIVLKSQRIRESFYTTYFPLSISKDVNDIGKFSLRKAKKILKDYYRLNRLINNTKPSLVYFAVSPSGMALFKDFVFFKIIRRKKIPVIFHHHGKGIQNYGQKSKIHHWIYSQMLSCSDNICLAKELTSDIHHYVSREPFIVFNAIEEENYHQQAISNKKSKARILYLSNFTKAKGLLDVLKAAAILKEKKLEFQISLVGKPYDIAEKELKDIIEKEGLSDFIKIPGPVYGKEKFKVIQAHDFLVLPTYYEKECLPLVLIEAMQCSLPVISTKEGGIPSIINDSINGFLIEKHDTKALADKMELLIKNPEIAKQMGHAARQSFELNFTLDKFESTLVNTLQSVLSKAALNK